MALLGQSRDSWPSMAPLGHVGLTKSYRTSRPIKRQLTVYDTSRPRGVNKNAKTFKKQKQKPKRKWKTKWKQKRKFIFIFIFVFVFILFFIFVFVFIFVFILVLVFVFILVFGFVFIFVLVFVFVFIYLFIYFFVFIFKFYYGISRPPYCSAKRCSYKFCKIHKKKRDSGTDILLWILRNFSKHLF